MRQSGFADKADLMSPRTAKYVEAMVREGFQYNKWLQRVRQEEAEATGTSGELGPTALSKPMRAPNERLGRPNPTSRFTISLRSSRSLRPRQARSQTRKAGLTRWLEKVHRASGEFQTSRSRDAVYDYLESVFAIVEHYRVRRRTNRLLRHAFKFADLPFDKTSDPYSAVIRCTSERDIDKKMISKWARVLRFVAARKRPHTSLKRFIKEIYGGINSCAEQYARFRRIHSL